MNSGNAVKLIEISVEIDGEAAEAVTSLFNQYGQGGTVIEEIPPEDASALSSKGTLAPVVRAKAFLCAEHSAALPRIEEALWHLGRIYPIPAPTVRWLSEADWTEAWKAGYKTQRIGRRILIKPSWVRLDLRPGQPRPAAQRRVVIELDPGLAFGTGLHPSTRLCLLAMEDYLQPGQRVLDVGTGSGILAIAAAKLGAESVVAIDIDDLALNVARENVQRNGVHESISLAKASLAPAETLDWLAPGSPVEVFNASGAWNEAFDLVLMNILPEVIADSAWALTECLASDGRFVVSGIVETREEFVRQALSAAGLGVAKRLVSKDWIALIGGKENRRSGAVS